MPALYALAIDIGTSRTAAATARTTSTGDVLTAPLPLGRASENAPTAVYVGDGELLFGDAAERRGATRPDRLVREFKRRIGDDVPIVAGDRRFDAEELYALVAEWVIALATEREGRPPAQIALTVPVSWGTYRTGLVAQALARHGWPDVEILTEPEAAARHYETTHPLAEGHALAVYDLGGGTFDAVVLTKTAHGVRVAGTPTGIADLGGADFDDAVLRYAIDAAGLSAVTLAGSPDGRLALAALRRECVEAKESLSFDSDVTLTVLGGGGHAEVRLPRDEFEAMIADDLERTADALETGIETAGLPIDDVDAILLTGGSSRIPRVAQVLSERFDRPIAIDADPKGIIALGAARAALGTAPTDAAVDEIAKDDDEELAPVFAAPPARRNWFRRVPPTAYAAGACALLLTGGGILAAPTLGSGVLAAQSWVTGSEPLAVNGALLDVLQPVAAVVSPPVAAPASPAVDTTTQTAPRTERASTGTNPRRSTERTETTDKPATRNTSTASGSTPSTGGGGSTPSTADGPATSGNGNGTTNGTQQPAADPPAGDPAPAGGGGGTENPGGETETPGGGGTENPGGGETENPGGGETETPGGGETETPGGGETETPVDPAPEPEPEPQPTVQSTPEPETTPAPGEPVA